MSKTPIPKLHKTDENEVILGTRPSREMDKFLTTKILNFLSQGFNFKVLFDKKVQENEIYMNEKDLKKFEGMEEFNVVQLIPDIEENPKSDKFLFLHVFSDKSVTEGYILISTENFSNMGILRNHHLTVSTCNKLFMNYRTFVYQLASQIQQLLILYVFTELQNEKEIISSEDIYEKLKELCTCICKTTCLTRELLVDDYFKYTMNYLKRNNFIKINAEIVSIIDPHPNLGENIKKQLGNYFDCLKGW